MSNLKCELGQEVQTVPKGIVKLASVWKPSRAYRVERFMQRCDTVAGTSP